MSKFTRSIALLSVVAAFYVGHGLHSNQPATFPTLTKQAHAGGASAIQAKYNQTVTIYTASEDGRKLFVWTHTGGTGKSPVYVGQFDAVKQQ